MSDIWANLRSRAVSAWRGTSHGAEYLGVADEPGLYRPYATIGLGGTSSGRARAFDVTSSWLLVGIRPVSIAVPVPDNAEEAGWLDDADEALLTLTEHPFELDGHRSGCATDPNWLAQLRLVRVAKAHIGGQHVVIFEGVHGRHRLVNHPGRIRLGADSAWRRHQTGQVRASDPIAPEGNGYDQLRIGYSTARPVLLALVRGADGFNLFPVDLQGPLGDHAHIVSLREGARVADQIAAAGGAVVSMMRAEACASVYALGGNHMAALSADIPLPVTASRTERLDVPVLRDAVSWRELRLHDVITVGKHRLHLMETLTRTTLHPNAPIVAHMHLWFAIWLDRHGHSPRYLPR